MALDELRLLSGEDYKVNDKIKILHPTLGQIKDFGEQKYFSIISNLIAIPSDMKSILWDIGIDYEEISEFELFAQLSKSFDVEDTRIILGDVNLQDLRVFMNNQNEQMFLSESSNFLDEIMILENETLDKFIADNFGDDSKNKALNSIAKLKSNKIDVDLFKNLFDKGIFEMRFPKTNGIVIDMHICMLITDYIRQMHGFEKKLEIAGNASTKQIMIDLDRDDRKINERKEFKSILAPLIKALVNCADFKYNFHDIWNLPITTFMESVKQIQKLKNFDFTMQGIYAGNIDAKKINKKELNWI